MYPAGDAVGTTAAGVVSAKPEAGPIHGVSGRQTIWRHRACRQRAVRRARFWPLQPSETGRVSFQLCTAGDISILREQFALSTLRPERARTQDVATSLALAGSRQISGKGRAPILLRNTPQYRSARPARWSNRARRQRHRGRRIPGPTPRHWAIRPAFGYAPLAPSKLTKVVGMLAKPRAVLAISNTVPFPCAPLLAVVPKRLP